MTISYQLAPIPKWYIADLTGKPLGAGTMYTYSNLDQTAFKYIYRDPNGNFPWTDPILFDENGSQGPFYWQVNSLDTTDTYHIEVYDANGVFQWSIDNFIPQGGGGGGGGSTALDLENLVTNNVFWRGTIGTTAVPTSTALKLAPSNHAGFTDNVANLNGLYTGPDIYFIKNNTSATDTLSLKKFTLGENPITSDIAPVSYLNYTCSFPGTGEIVKCVQFPITTKVQNLSNQAATVTIWARTNSVSPTQLTLQWLQFFGDGVGATSPFPGQIATLNLTTSWKRWVVSANVPDVSGKTLGSMGACGNDALFLQVCYPFGVTTNIDFVKPCVYLGNIPPAQEYHTYDMVDSIISAQRTGYVMSGFDISSPPGYVIMNDGTIGSDASTATTRANSDTFPLYNLLYNNVTIPSGNTLCVVTGYTGLPVDDYIANRTMQLPIMLGRALCSAGAGAGLSARALGSITGEETHLLTIGEMPNHGHPGSTVAAGVGAGTTGFSEANATSTHPVSVAPQGGGLPHNNMQPSSFMNFYIKL